MWQISYTLNDNGSFETQSVQGRITRRILKYARTCVHCTQTFKDFAAYIV